MRPGVLAYWRTFTEPLEAYIHTMYLDKHKDKAGHLDPLMTIGLGNLIDPVNLATGLAFQWRPGTPKAGQCALTSEIADEWNKLHRDRMRLALAGWKACEKICQLELSSDAIDDLVSKKLAENETTLKKQFKDFDQWPADAQLAIHSLAWARGAAGFEIAMPKFSRFLSQPGGPDFAGAATECRLTKDEKTDYSHFMRNNANQQLFRNAAAVVAGEPDGFYRRELLYYPMVVMPPMIIEGKAGEQIDD